MTSSNTSSQQVPQNGSGQLNEDLNQASAHLLSSNSQEHGGINTSNNNLLNSLSDSFQHSPENQQIGLNAPQSFLGQVDQQQIHQQPKFPVNSNQFKIQTQQNSDDKEPDPVCQTLVHHLSSGDLEVQQQPPSDHAANDETVNSEIVNAEISLGENSGQNMSETNDHSQTRYH